MPIEVIMPQLGESVVEGTVTKWLKQVGETIEEFEPLLEINTIRSIPKYLRLQVGAC